MGVTRAPWWSGWALLGGLLLVFLGERVLGTGSVARALASGAGALVVLGCLLWRARSWRAASGQARGVEAMLLVSYAGVVLALLLYLVSSDDGMRWLGIRFADELAGDRYRVVLHVIWPILLAVSLLPALGAQLALAAHRHAGAAAAGIEALRSRGTARAGLTIALVGAFLFVVGYVASARDTTLDLSYFKTSSPGTATLAMVDALSEPLHVELFFPDVNPVKDEALGYFRALAGANGRVDVEARDRFRVPELARRNDVTRDGVVLLTSGDRSERLDLGTELGSARKQLRRMDGEVQQRLMSLLRERRTIYFTMGHGELNDTASAGPLAAAGLGGVERLRELLQMLNLTVRDFGLTQGLGREVPEDAAVVAILGPRRPFLPEELAALDRYLAGGGALLLALEPDSDFRLGPLASRLGVRFDAHTLADDEQHLRQRGGPADRRLIVTDGFSAHAAVTTASRAGVGAAALFVGAGHLEAADSGPSPRFIIRSLPSTFADLDGDFEFDDGTEERRPYNLAAAVEAPAATADDSTGEPRMRALVFADAEMFTDAVLETLGLNAALVVDGIKWLGSEEALAGVPESEEDVPIQHTRAEDVAWFYSTILGAPALVLLFGLVGVHTRRRRRGGSA